MNVRMCVCMWASVHSIWVLIISKCWNDTKENINGSLVISLMGMYISKRPEEYIRHNILLSKYDVQ